MDDATQSPSLSQSTASPRRPIVRFLLTFLCVFTGLALLHGVGPSYARAHAELANAFVDRVQLASGVRLHFEGPQAVDDPWSASLHVDPAAERRRAIVPVDLRSLVFLPTAAFIALSIAVSLRSLREHLLLLGVGLLILEPLSLGLVALPLVSFLGGTGPIQAFRLSRPTHAVLQVMYRALVTPPGMAYAVPLFLWWVLMARLVPRVGDPLKTSRSLSA